MPARVLRWSAVAVAPLLLVTGCREAAERVFATPRVEFRGADVRTVGLGGGSLDVVLRLHNPNPYSLTATGARYRLFAGDSMQLGQGSTGDTVTVAARDSAEVRLPVELSWQALGRAASGAMRDGQIAYRVLGEVDVRTPIGTRTVPIDARGRARAPRIGR
jgi:LEA14-like dessication related protein